MTFTYTGDPSVSTRDQIRFLIGDTIATDPHFTDEEIAWTHTQWNDIYDTSASLADILAGRYSHRADETKTVGDLTLSIQYSRAAEGFREMAHHLRQMRNRQYTPVPRFNSQALVATENRNVETYNTDFRLGQDDFVAPPGSTSTGANS
jgi:hypothetical protein